MNSACVIVMGDLGRSPRMLNHAISITDTLDNTSVDLVGFAGSELPTAVRENPRIRVRYISTAIQDKLRRLPRIFYPIYALIRILIEVLILLWILLFSVRRPRFYLIQNPPSIPSLVVCILVKWIKRTRLIIDWHNYGFTILRVNGRNRLFVGLMKFYETKLGRLANGHLCVSEAMRRDLLNQYRIPASVLYDKANQRFRLLPLHERHEFYKKFFSLEPTTEPQKEVTKFTIKSTSSVKYRPDRPLLMVSSSSYTPDEDFNILVKSLDLLDKGLTNQDPDFIVVLTGRGPLRDHFAGVFAARQYRKIRVLMRWLEPDDYPKLLGSADLGICFHYSSSGLDLPMKVVDMFATQLPVLAVGYQSIGELVKEGVNGHVFADENDLTARIIELARNRGKLEQYKENLATFRNDTWETHWRNVVPRLIQ